MGAAERLVMSEEAYLRYELEHEGRHEFDDGEIVAMTGAEPTHNQAVGNLDALLRAGVRSKGCFVWSQDQRVRAKPRYYYPDIVVACGSPKFGDDEPASLLDPTVLIEVLSETTAQRDVGKKRKHYQQIASLQEYVVVDCPEPSMLLWRRGPDGRWTREDIDEGEVEIAGVKLRLPDIYEGVAVLAEAMGHRFEE